MGEVRKETSKCDVWSGLEGVESLKNRNDKARAAMNFEKTFLFMGQMSMEFLLVKEFCAYI